MASNDLTLAMRLLLDSQRFVNGINGAGRVVTGFTSGVRNEFAQLRNSFNTVQGKLAAVGVGVGVVATGIQSAQLDKSLSQIALTAGVGASKIEQLRNRLHALSAISGKRFEDLQAGFNSLVQSGLSFDQALATMDGINQAMAVTGADAQTLANAITVAGEAFHFDLSNPQMAVQLLEKMTVAGRLGNAELEDLSGIFSRVGIDAKAAGIDFDTTLAFIEVLSKIEKNPERLATLGASTLRVFTNAKYSDASTAATGVKFFDAKGSQRDALEVMKDIKLQYDKLTTDEQRKNFISAAFQNTDLDTIKGMRTLLDGNRLAGITEFTKSVGAAGGTFKHDMHDALNNAVDQAGRLKATLREAADGFAMPINKALANTVQKLLNKKEDGGLGLNGIDLFGVGAATVVAGYLAKRIGLPGVGLAGGVVAGKALEQAAGVTPVFVTNWQDGGSGAGGSAATAVAGAAAVTMFSKVKALTVLLARTPLKELGTWGAGGLAASAGMVGAAGLAGYGFGSAVYKWQQDNIQKIIENSLAAFGNQNADRLISQRNGTKDFTGTLKIDVEDHRIMVSRMLTSSPSLQMDVTTFGKQRPAIGTMMVMP